MNNTEEMEHYKSHFSSIIQSLINPHTIFPLRISYHRDPAPHLYVNRTEQYLFLTLAEYRRG